MEAVERRSGVQQERVKRPVHEVIAWLREGKAIGATHLLIVVDNKGEDYPRFVRRHETLNQALQLIPAQEGVSECFKVEEDWWQQLLNRR